ncbi:MAG: hypothetical protein JWP97_5967 [Labilithrix sp.]|nr:hypothetical protein [Labilithrix sp.]
MTVLLLVPMPGLVLSLGRALFTGLAVSLAVGMSAGCASHAEDPQSVLRGYSHALEEGRAEDAYRMLSDEARRGISLEAFRRMVKDNPDEVKDIAKALARPASTPVVTATVTSGTGQELQLVLENGAWKVEATAIDLYAQDSPRHAIQGFVRAVERKRYDVVLKFVPDAHKEGLDPAKLKTAWEGHDKDEIEQVVSSLRQALPSASIEETGDRATMAYGAGTMQLVRERGLWKIEDFD